MLNHIHGAVIVNIDAGDFTHGGELSPESRAAVGAVRREYPVVVDQIGNGVRAGVTVRQIQIPIPGFIVGNHAAEPDGGAHCQLAGVIGAAIVGPHHLR